MCERMFCIAECSAKSECVPTRDPCRIAGETHSHSQGDSFFAMDGSALRHPKAQILTWPRSEIPVGVVRFSWR